MNLEKFDIYHDKKSTPSKKQKYINQDSFGKSDEEKIIIIENLFSKIMVQLGLDLKDDSLKDTPKRIAIMYVKEIFSGLNKQNKPKISLFDNKFDYEKTITQKNINLISMCEHHFLPFIGHAHVGYISSGRIIGLSKLNRVVKFYSKKPQVQERLTKEIFDELKNILHTESVIIVIEAKHLCVSCRGVEDTESSTTTVQYGGEFNTNSKKEEFFTLIK